MEEQLHQMQQAALNVQLGPSKLLLEMLLVLLVQLVKVLLPHSQFVQLVDLMSTVQMQGTPVLPVWQPLKLQILPLDRQNAVSKATFQDSQK